MHVYGWCVNPSETNFQMWTVLIKNNSALWMCTPFEDMEMAAINVDIATILPPLIKFYFCLRARTATKCTSKTIPQTQGFPPLQDTLCTSVHVLSSVWNINILLEETSCLFMFHCFLVFHHTGKYTALDLFYFVNLTSSKLFTYF